MIEIKENEFITTTDSTDSTFTIEYPSVSDNTIQVKPLLQEIADLKKEIQELKDMIAEHILLGHQENL